MDINTILGRYEDEDSRAYATFTISNKSLLGEPQLYTYSYGPIGFPASGSKIRTEYEVRDAISTLSKLGYIRVDETPLSEISSYDGGILLDWMNKIER